MSLCHGQKKCLCEKETSHREEEKTILQLVCCRKGESGVLFWLEQEVQHGSGEIWPYQYPLQAVAFLRVSRLCEREKLCHLQLTFSYGFSVWKVGKY